MNHFKQKNKKLEKLRGIFFQLGLIIAGGLTLVAFEWTSSVKILPPEDDCIGCTIDITELPPITFQD